MLIFELLSWWYGAGWRGRSVRVRNQLAGLMDYFSIDLMLRSLFAPFRQISAGGEVKGPLSVRFQAILDRLISRLVGAAVRSMIIIAGVIAMLLSVVFGLLTLVLWALAPVLPAIGFVMMVGGYILWLL